MKTPRQFLSLLAAIAVLLAAVEPLAAAGTDAPALAYSYIVQPGDSLVTISRKFGVSAGRILDINNLRSRPDLIYIGQKLIIPIDIGATPSYVSPFFYTVQTGDTVQSLASRFYIDKFALRQANYLPEKTNLLSAGTTILIPAGPHRYVIQTGDTLQSIAAMFGTTTSAILKYNTHLGNGTSLFPGQNVFIAIVWDATYSPALAEGTGGGGEGTTAGATPGPNGLRPTDSAEVARAANANVTAAFQTITMPQNVVNLSGSFAYKGFQVRRSRVDPSRPNGAITTIAIEFRGGDGAYTIKRYDEYDGPLSSRGVNMTGIWVNAGSGELWNNIEVELLGNCESVNHSILYITTAGVQHTVTLDFKSDCPAK